ncbi:5'-3' exonuclease, SAM fold family protein [Mycobacterium xenopi 4042]|uniref:5'-3' exonuclease n=1 Tax=Mycobacterium xenopi 4042 TaxID=1299334 RepID=X7YQN1_MYCXE|nr:5'-3' exonuclease, SAM fold family protein [Mycobacterium xenopi 4042]
MSPAKAAAPRRRKPDCKRRQADTAAVGRQFAGVPGVLRTARGEFQDRRRADHQRGLRVYRDADQPAARRTADACGRRVRRVAGDISRRPLPGIQGQPDLGPDEFHGQIDITKEVLAALGITVLAEPGFEADDIIATLATQAEKEGYRVLVVTGDRDALQLVSDDVTVLYPRKGVSDLTRFTPEAVVDKYGLTPKQYPDFAALRGDPSDNLPGIPGVGEKTAAKWIAEYGSLEGLVDNVDTVKGKVGDALRAHLASVVRNRELTELIRDVPLAQTPTRCGCSPGTGIRSTGCSTTWSSGCCATGCSRRWQPSSPKSTRGSTCAAARWSRAPSGSGWPHTPEMAGAAGWRSWAPTCPTGSGHRAGHRRCRR